MVCQTYKKFEWIVIDGGSTDGTLEILTKYKKYINKLVSERDRGIYDGMNKGIKKANGEYILFLNGGDSLYSKNVLFNIFNKQTHSEDILYGDVNIIMKNQSVTSNFPNKLDKGFFLNDCINHQSTFIKRKLFKTYGNYNTKYLISADYEKWLKFLSYKASFKKIPYIVSNFNFYDGKSSDIKNEEIIKREKRFIHKNYFRFTDILWNKIHRIFLNDRAEVQILPNIYINIKYIPKIDLLVKLIYLFCIFQLAKNLVNPFLWYDETNQFWISQGLNGFSPQYSTTGSLSNIISNNINHNLDPPLFSLLLRLWSNLGSNYVIIRMLPFIFFISCSVICYKVAKTWTSNRNYLILSMFIPFISPLILHYAFEVRAYSMETLSALFAIFLLQYQEILLKNYKKSILGGLVAAFLCTSRYSAYIPTILAILFIGAWIIAKNQLKEYYISFSCLSMPTLISLGLVYLSTLRFQDTLGSLPPSYTIDFMLKKTGILPVILQYNHIFIYLPLLLLIIFSLVSFLVSKSLVSKPYLKYMFFALTLNLILILFSFVGLHTWGLDSKWDISSHTILIFGYLPLGIFLTSKIKRGYVNSLIVLLFSILIYITNILTFKYKNGESTYTNLLSGRVNKNSKMLINAASLPTVKYLVEKGPLKQYVHTPLYDDLAVFNHDFYRFEGRAVELTDNLDQYEYISLTHISYLGSYLQKYFENHPYWIDISTQDNSSKLFKNTLYRTIDIQ